MVTISSKQLTQSYNLDLQLYWRWNDQVFSFSYMIRNLGIVIVCRSCYISTHNLDRVRKYLDFDSLENLVQCFISSKLDYCNAFYLGLTAIQLNRLQRVQNVLVTARVLTCTCRHEHISLILYQLHWLPVEYRVQFKLLLMIHKVLKEKAPAFL